MGLRVSSLPSSSLAMHLAPEALLRRAGRRWSVRDERVPKLELGHEKAKDRRWRRGTDSEIATATAAGITAAAGVSAPSKVTTARIAATSGVSTTAAGIIAKAAAGTRVIGVLPGSRPLVHHVLIDRLASPRAGRRSIPGKTIIEPVAGRRAEDPAEHGTEKSPATATGHRPHHRTPAHPHSAHAHSTHPQESNNPIGTKPAHAPRLVRWGETSQQGRNDIRALSRLRQFGFPVHRQIAQPLHQAIECRPAR